MGVISAGVLRKICELIPLLNLIVLVFRLDRASTSWDEEVAAFAESYAQQMASDCSVLQHSGTSLYGENLYMDGNTAATASDAVKLWVQEKVYFDFNERKCHDIMQCGHFSQVVWRASTAIGCARADCQAGGVGAVFTCNYKPPGNYVGEPAY